jgi:hypothetical protein
MIARSATMHNCGIESFQISLIKNFSSKNNDLKHERSTKSCILKKRAVNEVILFLKKTTDGALM